MRMLIMILTTSMICGGCVAPPEWDADDASEIEYIA